MSIKVCPPRRRRTDVECGGGSSSGGGVTSLNAYTGRRPAPPPSLSFLVKMSAPQQQVYIQQAPPQQSVLSKRTYNIHSHLVGMGAVMGSLVGLTIGFIGGGFQILRYVPCQAYL